MQTSTLPQDFDLTIEASRLYSDILSELRLMWKAALAYTPWSLKRGPIRAFNNFARHWTFVPCDKNAGRVMAMCPLLYYRSVSTLSSDPQQFVGVPHCT